MKFWYKKKDLKCCKNGHPVTPSPDELSITKLWEYHLYGTHVVQEYDSFWKMKRWVIVCQRCQFEDSLKETAGRLNTTFHKNINGTNVKFEFTLEKHKG